MSFPWKGPPSLSSDFFTNLSHWVDCRINVEGSQPGCLPKHRRIVGSGVTFGSQSLVGAMSRLFGNMVCQMPCLILILRTIWQL